MFILHAILPLLFPFILANAGALQLQTDITKDLRLLQHDSRIYISDNTSASPSVQTVAADLQLFGVVAGMDLSQAKYSSHRQGNHQVEKWMFAAGEIKAVYQIQSTVRLDTVVTQRYLDNRTPTKQRVTNDFTFRTYAVVTNASTPKLYYQTEQDQGLLAYKIGDRQVQIGYASKKEGLVDVLPQLTQQAEALLKKYSE